MANVAERLPRMPLTNFTNDAKCVNLPIRAGCFLPPCPTWLIAPNLVPRPRSLEAANFGTLLFTGAVAAKYLVAQGLPADTMKTDTWTKTNSDKVASAILEWAKDNGACAYPICCLLSSP
jgi:hypothetical protein